MAQIELKSKSLKNYILRVLEENGIEKKEDELYTTEELESIKSLTLDRDILTDLEVGELVFFKSLTSLNLNRIDIDQKTVDILSSLKKLQTLSISNAVLSVEELECLNLQDLILVNCEGIDVNQFKKCKNITNLTMINCKDANLKGISNFEKLNSVNLANNEWMRDKDVEDLWNSESIKSVIFDGSNNITDVEHEGIKESHESEYKPVEENDWISQEASQDTTPKLRFMGGEESESAKWQVITLSDEEIKQYLSSEEGMKTLELLAENGKNRFNISITDTSKISESELAKLEALKEKNLIKIDRIYVKTGWNTTQNRGYSFQTFKAIKQEISKYVDDIKNDPSLTEEQKFLKVRQRITSSIRYNYGALRARQGDREFYSSRNLEDGLLNHTCVCAGYADIMKNVLSELNIECKYIEGDTSTGEYHAWNQVKLMGDDGQYHWYNDDTTWDAVAVSSGKNGFKYCLMNDIDFSKTHRGRSDKSEGSRIMTCNSASPLAVRVARNNTTNGSMER